MFVRPDELYDFLENNRTDEDDQAMRDCQVAAARGDAQTALDAYRRGLHIADAPQEVMLEALASLGASAPPWMLARWMVSQAYGWMLLNEDPRTDLAVRMTMATCYEVPEGISDHDLREFGTQIGGCDWATHQLATFDLGGLADYLDVVADDDLIARAPMIRDWESTPIRPYRYDSVGGSNVGITDVGSRERHEVPNRGCLQGSRIGAYVLARVVPAGTGAGHMLASRPLGVDEQTAHKAGENGLDSTFPGWLLAMSEAFHDGRLPEGVGRRSESFLNDAPLDYPCAS